MCLAGTVSDVAGEIVEVGPAVKSFKAGDKVVAMLNPFVSTISSFFNSSAWYEYLQDETVQGYTTCYETLNFGYRNLI